MSDGNGKAAVVAGGGILAALAGAGRFADDGCRACGTAARHGDDVAHVRHVGDLGHGAGGADDLARAGRLGGASSDDLARGVVVGEAAGVHGGEQAVKAATPHELGFSTDVARRAERYAAPKPGAVPTRTVGSVRVQLSQRTEHMVDFAVDLSKAAAESKLDPTMLADLLDVFTAVQDMAGGDGDPGEVDHEGLAEPDRAAAMTATIERELATLPPEARRSVERHLGPPEVIAYRIAEARPFERTR